MTDTDQQQTEHKKKMQVTKAAVDARVADAQEERGTLIVLTGDGKGKSSSGFGTIARSVGYGLKTGVVQFVKGKWPCGERDLLEKLGVPFYVMGTGFTWETQNREVDIAAAKRVWDGGKTFLADPSVHLVLLDELTYMLTYEYLDLDEVMAALKARPREQSVIITGRNCHPAIIEMADTVSEIQPLKHAFEAGIKARKGVDW
jgi:cob(I)alamin adenosyltransferase